MYASNLQRSATAPEMMVAPVAAKVNWKNLQEEAGRQAEGGARAQWGASPWVVLVVGSRVGWLRPVHEQQLAQARGRGLSSGCLLVRQPGGRGVGSPEGKGGAGEATHGKVSVADERLGG